MHHHTQSRHRRARKSRGRIRLSAEHRLTVYRTPRHIYAQLSLADGSRTLAVVCTLQKEFRGDRAYGGNVEAARRIGAAVATKAEHLGIRKVAFDRAGYKYHGRVKALAESARAAGLEF